MNELPLYQIVNWNDYFENNKSRQRDRCGFVCVPNKHGGQGWTAVMNCGPDDEGAKVYGTWINIIEYISRQRSPREGYLTSDGRKDGMRLCVAELARMLKISPGLVRRTLSVLCQVGWLCLLDGHAEISTVTQNVTLAVTDDDCGDGHSYGHSKRHSGGHSESNSGNNGHLEQTVTQNVTPAVTEAVTPTVTPAVTNYGLGRSNERKKERKKEPSSVSQRETGGECMNIEQTEKWISSLFGRQRAWSYEEKRLLTDLLPISKPDRALLSWAYTLPRDIEGWVLVNGQRASKPKDSVIALLREFSSEVDKWLGKRSGGVQKKHGAATEDLLSDEWASAIKKLYGPDCPVPRLKSQVAPSAREEIEAAIREETA